LGGYTRPTITVGDRWLYSIRRYAAACLSVALVCLALAPVGVARAERSRGGGGGAVTLRYRFVPGQTVSYAVALVQRGDVSALTAAPDAPLTALARDSVATYVASDQEHRRVLGVDAAGNGRIILTVDHPYETINGRFIPPPADRRFVTLGAFTVAPDGTQLAGPDERSRSDLAENGPVLPVTPVALGAHWTTHVWLAVPGVALLVRRVTSVDTLVGFTQAGGEPVALIDARLPLYATTVMAVGGEAAHVEETGMEAVRFAVGVESGQVVSSVQRIVTSVTVRQGADILRETFTIDATQRRLSTVG